ncbi:hypothetical protein jhhlp_000950 [Lomentospora prolificans]|uniref:Uncharacterized protein n=1 Tax=Lomentospora prolificans TaxID=41688 RepID=A0A2N3NK65_9PEZI|nr:hypothetical protein jhhlp_000950 [Lomentospora prolificans]
MDIHRCRFLPYSPAAINAIAFSHPRAQNAEQASSARLAIGRENGDIEIWNPLNGVWLQEKVIHGGSDRSIDGLVWVTEPDRGLADNKIAAGRMRLFSIGSSSTITEWDLLEGAPKRHATGNHGEVWCLAAQPVSSGKSNLQTTRLIAGTIKGELVSYSVEDDSLRFDKVLVRSQAKKHQALSLAFLNSHTAVVGCSDSTIRIYDTKKGMLLRTMTLGSDLAGGARDIIVWSVKCLPDGDIVSADSTGQVCIWDSKTYTQTQRLQSHDSDALSLAVSADGSIIASGGMDRRTIFYKKVAGSDRWGKVWGRRYHDHDVKAMAAFESGNKSVIVSGGPDAAPVVLPMKELGLENHRKLSHLPQQPPLLSAVHARFIVSWWNQEIHIWSLQRPFGPLYKKSSGAGVDGNQKLLKTIILNTESNISSAVINSAGTFLAVSSAASGIKAFHLSHHRPTSPADIQVSPIKLPADFTQMGAASLSLSPDARWLCIVQESETVLVSRIDRQSTSKGAPSVFSLSKAQRLKRLRRDVPRHKLLGGLGSYDRSITKTCFSPDSKMLATVDLAGYIDTWLLRGLEKPVADEKGQEDDGENSSSSSGSDGEGNDDEASNGHKIRKARWTRNPAAGQLPKLSSTPVVLSFSHDLPRTKMTNGTSETTADTTAYDDYTLLAVTAPFDVLAFHPLKGSLTNWTRRTRGGGLPPEMLDGRDAAKGVVWQGSRAWIYGPSFIYMLDLHVDPKISSSHSKKRKRLDTDSGAGNRMQVGALGPHKVYKFDGASKETHALLIGGRNRDEVDISDDENEEGTTTQSSELMALRKKEVGEEKKGSATRWWTTTKYRPILGIVPLSNSPSTDHQVEVALIERPHWAIDLPERYVSNKDRTYY